MRKTILIILVMLVNQVPAKAALWYSSGDNNTFTYSDLQGEEVFVENDAVLNYLSGSSAGLRVIHTATANIYGGDITYDLYTSNSSVTNIYNIDLDILVSDHDSIVNIFAYDVDFYSIGGSENEGYMTGLFYQNNESFSIDFWNEGTVSHVNIVPEPTTFLLMGLGGLLLRKRKSGKQRV